MNNQCPKCGNELYRIHASDFEGFACLDGMCRDYKKENPTVNAIAGFEIAGLNYPTKSIQDLFIEDLQRENDAAFERIQKLSKALLELGFDPTQLPDDPRI